MPTTLNRPAFQQLIDEDLAWLDTMPRTIERQHIADCLRSIRDCYPSQIDAAETFKAAIRKHRDERGDDRCWLDDEALYKSLPEGYAPPVREVAVELAFCERYIRCRRNPATEYVSPQRRIEELEAALKVRAEELDTDPDQILAMAGSHWVGEETKRRISELELKWSNTPPTVVGWYWFRKYPSWRVEMKEIVRGDSGVLFDGWPPYMTVRETEGKCCWAGPISQPV